LNQLALRPLQSTEAWPYSTDTTDPKRIEAYYKHLNQQVEKLHPPPTPLATETTLPQALLEPEKRSKCPFGFGRK
jgi:hypothetical protein